MTKEVAEDDGNPFDKPGCEEGDAIKEVSAAESAVQSLREELDLAPVTFLSLPYQRTPLFLSHGVQDEKVAMHLGREANACVHDLSGDVSWKEYEGLRHWYSAEMLADMVAFLKAKTKWAATNSAS